MHPPPPNVLREDHYHHWVEFCGICLTDARCRRPTIRKSSVCLCFIHLSVLMKEKILNNSEQPLLTQSHKHEMIKGHVQGHMVYNMFCCQVTLYRGSDHVTQLNPTPKGIEKSWPEDLENQIKNKHHWCIRQNKQNHWLNFSRDVWIHIFESGQALYGKKGRWSHWLSQKCLCCHANKLGCKTSN